MQDSLCAPPADSPAESGESAAQSRAKQAQLENLMDSIPGGVAMFRVRNGEGELIYQTKGVAALTGRDERGIVLPGGRLPLPEDEATVRAALIRASDCGETCSVTYRMPEENGGFLWVTANFRKTGVEEGCPIVHAVFTTLSNQGLLYRMLVEGASSGIIVRDKNTYELLYANPAAHALLRTAPGDYAGKKCYEYFHGGSASCPYCAALSFEKDVIRDADVYIPRLDANYSIKGALVDWVGREAVVEYINDVSEIQRSRSKMNDLVSSVACGLVICSVTAEGVSQLEYLNDGFFHICEGDRETLTELYKRDPLAGIHPEDVPAFLKMMTDVNTHLVDRELTYRFQTQTGRLKWILIKVKAVRHQDGSGATYASYFDITDQMLLQQRFSNVIQTVPCGIGLYRWDGRSLTPLLVNSRLSEILGENALDYLSDVTGLNYTHAHPDDLPMLQEAARRGLTENGRIDCSYRSLHAASGKYLWIRMRGLVLPQPDGGKLVYVSYTDVTDEHMAEQRLRESEQALEYAAEHAGLWYWRYDAATGRAWLDNRSQREFGLPPVMDDFVESFLALGVIAPEYEETYRRAYEALAAGEKQVTFEARAVMRDGAAHWMRFCFTNLFDESGNVTVSVCTAVFIDSEKELSAKYELEKRKPSLKEDDLIVHSLFNLTTGETLEYVYRDGSQVPMEDRTAFTDGAENVERLLVDEAERAAFRELNDRQRLLEHFSKGETEFRLDYRRRLPGGEIIWVRNILHLVRAPYSSDILLFEYYYNVEGEKLRELTYRSIAADNYDYVARIDGRTRRFTVLHRREDGYRMPPASGEDADDVAAALSADNVAEEDRPIALQNTLVETMKKNLAENERFQFGYQELQPDGSVKHKKITQYYLDREREIIIMTREDVTPIIKAEAEKNAMLASALSAANAASMAKSQFLSRMSHELRTPMNAIIGLSALAAGDVSDPAAMEDAIGKIGMSARYLLSLINDILEMSRIESGRMTVNEAPFDFEELMFSVNNIIYGQASDKGLDYDAAVNGLTERRYVGDAVKLQQILINVLGNSVKFTPPGGKVSLSVEQLRRVKDRAAVRFTVSDTGCGIDEAFLPHLFDTFSQEEGNYTSTSSGTGLGLSITKSMVEMMNGHISVKSIKHIGSVFTIELPLGISEESRSRNDALSAMNLSRLRALVVDDDVTVCRSTENILSAMGLQAEWADSGRRAVELVAERRREKRDFHAIFIDWKMPDMDGIETTRQIRRIVGPEVTIVIMTAYDWKSFETQARDAGVDMFMEKPLMRTSITAALEKMLGAKNEGAPSPAPVTFDFTGRRFLLAEDHPLNVEVARRLLEKVGAEVTVAGNGLEALELFTTAEEHWFDAILMDIRMPVMDGLTATRNIRKLKKAGSREIPIVAMTANAFDEDVEASLTHGMDAHLIKPIDPQTMYATLRRLLDER